MALQTLTKFEISLTGFLKKYTLHTKFHENPSKWEVAPTLKHGWINMSELTGSFSDLSEST
jgi:hypothetical protein